MTGKKNGTFLQSNGVSALGVNGLLSSISRCRISQSKRPRFLPDPCWLVAPVSSSAFCSGEITTLAFSGGSLPGASLLSSQYLGHHSGMSSSLV